jgi:hypothetical protein
MRGTYSKMAARGKAAMANSSKMAPREIFVLDGK